MPNSKEEKERYAREFMVERGLKGKSLRMKIIRIIEKVGLDKRKIDTALLRSNIAERIKQE